MTYARRRPGSHQASLLEKRVSLPLRADGAIRLAVIADTHSRPHPKSAELVAAQRPDAILHAGDIGDLEVIAHFEHIAPVFAVRGNIDGHGPQLPDELELELTGGATDAQSEEVIFKLLLLHIGVNGPKLRADAARSAGLKHAQLVVCGHSHVPFMGADKGFTIFNPGSIGPRRFNLPIVFGMLELSSNQLRLWHVDCETGARWMPP